jgi:hypothetical protein
VGPKAAVALSLVILIGFPAAFMYLVTTFLFHFSSSQDRMGPVVNYGALAVVTGTMLLAAIVWKIRSPNLAVTYAAITTPVAWAVAVCVEWLFSFVLGSG